MRRGALNDMAKEYGCDTLALGHHMDDVLETFLLNMLYTGSLSTFAPKSFMDRTQITLIRPLILLSEKDAMNINYGFVNHLYESKTRQAEVSDYARAKGNYANLGVQNNGDGIDLIFS